MPISRHVGRGRNASAARPTGPKTSRTASGPLISVPAAAAKYGASIGGRGGGRSSQRRPASTPSVTQAVNVMSRFA